MATQLMTVSVVQAIADDIRSRILRGEYPSDTSFTETDVAARYEVARPTAKAAIEKLVSESLLERPTNKTAKVMTLGPDDVRDIYLTRARLEKAVLLELAESRTVPPAAVAAQRDLERIDSGSGLDTVDPDMRFHMALVDSIGSPRTSRMYESLVSQVRLCMAQVQGLELVQPERIVREHQHLLDLIEAGDGPAATAFLDEHLSRPRERLVAAVGGVPGPEADLGSSLDAQG
ncbi:GntR family transcriptional regulator [Arthrobacter sp. NPDC093128]|uniref:GntR family transcriptional regulator n=1 Tax=Arthrobacter sp. NPDC093128 TaxID=3154979 RepID=UPI00343C708A